MTEMASSSSPSGSRLTPHKADNLGREWERRVKVRESVSSACKLKPGVWNVEMYKALTTQTGNWVQRWFSDRSAPESSGELLETGISGSHLSFWFQLVCVGAWEFAFLTNSLVRLMLLVPGHSPITLLWLCNDTSCAQASPACLLPTSFPINQLHC